MPAKPLSVKTAEHYTWGGPHATDCDAWYLLQTMDLHIIEERMPPGTSETRHHHARSRQFFYVLAGELIMEIEHHTYLLRTGEGIEVAPGRSHQAANRGSADLRILVTSQPPAHGDRIADEAPAPPEDPR